jgi:hypothetical protein
VIPSLAHLNPRSERDLDVSNNIGNVLIILATSNEAIPQRNLVALAHLARHRIEDAFDDIHIGKLVERAGDIKAA